MTNRSTPLSTSLRGQALLNQPHLNKATAFSLEERRSLGISGLLPTTVEPIETQLERRRFEYDKFHNDMERHIFLRSLQDDNETLFYAFVKKYLAEVLPIIYTPTVGAACQQFSRIYRRPRGLFISYDERADIVNQFDSVSDDIDVIVVTDGERILGLGDQGIGGMGIPIGKLALYSAVGGIDPAKTLPIVLDCGTNNEELLADPLYMGRRERRVTGSEYCKFVDVVVEEIKRRFPSALLQWEDFAQPNAAPLLQIYRDELLTFNDDIQGTAAVAFAAVEASVAAAGTKLTEQRICIAGAGSAGTGIATMLRDALLHQGVKNVHEHLFLVDRAGLLHDGRDDLSEYQRPFAQPVGTDSRFEHLVSLLDVVEEVQPSVLLGVSGAAGLFTEEVVTSMARNVDRPIIMPMSNPTSRAEATPSDLLAWTEGRALMATGSPFEPVEFEGRTVHISQANNVYVFPGVGLGARAVGATRVTESMLVAAAKAVADHSLASDANPDSGLLPPIEDVSQTARSVAEAVGIEAVASGVADAIDDDEVRRLVAERIWLPLYRPLVAASDS